MYGFGVERIRAQHIHEILLSDALFSPYIHKGPGGSLFIYVLAEAINGLYKAELIHRRASWKTRKAAELATLEWVSWFSHHRRLQPFSFCYIPPAQTATNYYRRVQA